MGTDVGRPRPVLQVELQPAEPARVDAVDRDVPVLGADERVAQPDRVACLHSVGRPQRVREIDGEIVLRHRDARADHHDGRGLRQIDGDAGTDVNHGLPPLRTLPRYSVTRLSVRIDDM